MQASGQNTGKQDNTATRKHVSTMSCTTHLDCTQQHPSVMPPMQSNSPGPPKHPCNLVQQEGGLPTGLHNAATDQHIL
jgi:hypothetical protein